MSFMPLSPLMPQGPLSRALRAEEQPLGNGHGTTFSTLFLGMMKHLKVRFSESPFAPDKVDVQHRVGRDLLGAQKWHSRAWSCISLYISHTTKTRRKVWLGAEEKTFYRVSLETLLP